MSKKLYVGNLAFSVTSDDLDDLFATHGNVTSASVISDRDTGRSRGFAFVEMSEGSDQAIKSLNGVDFKGRALVVNEARPRADRGDNSSGGRSRSGYGGGGRW